MPWFDYEIATGHDNSGSTANFETYFNVPLRGQRVPLGSVTRTTLDRKRHTNGRRLVTLSQEGCTYDELDAYVTAIFGGWSPTAESVEVTLRHRGLDNAFHYYNALAHFPRDGEHYEHVTTEQIQNLRLEFDILEDL